MKKFIKLGMLSLTLFLAGCTTTEAKISDPNVNMNVRNIAFENSSIVEVLDGVKSAVVGISADYNDGYSVGSGVALNNGNYVLTNYHVIEGGKNLTLYFADKTTGKANSIWYDKGLDLAILKSSREIPYLSAIKENINIGEDVYAIGTPLTLQFKHSVTKGIVSAKDRVLEIESSSKGSTFQQSLIQHDASINPGNSGGPLINSQGRVVGINTYKTAEGEGIGFAIPIKVGESILNRIIENNSYISPYMGVFGFDSEIAEVYGEQLSMEGVYVISTTGPAFDIGIKKGDLIIKLGDYDIHNMLDLRVALFNFDVDDEVDIQYLRDGELVSDKITLSKR
ncbi:MAG: serine protease [Clostridia bacterium]|nr:serine protease [Clostridia bacterium]